MGKRSRGVLMSRSGADDYQMTVTSVEKINGGYMRLASPPNGYWRRHPPHP